MREVVDFYAEGAVLAERLELELEMEEDSVKYEDAKLWFRVYLTQDVLQKHSNLPSPSSQAHSTRFPPTQSHIGQDSAYA